MAIVRWVPITAERYDEMLNILPPIGWCAAGFLVMEPIDDCPETRLPRFGAFRQQGAEYFESSRPITRAEWRVMRTERITFGESEQ
jgi:hypothetical protein